MNVPKLRFKNDYGSDFPEWKESALGDLGSFFSGGTPLTTNKEYYDGDVPFIKSGELGSYSTAQTISELGLKNSSAKMVNAGDLLYALYGATSGEVAISKIDGAINQAILCIRTKLKTYFLYSYLLFQKENILSTYLQGGQGNLSAEIIKKLNVPYPCEEEQTKIANFLTAVDEKITQLTQKHELLNQYKKGVMQKIFSQELRFKNDDGSEFPEWEEKSLDDVCDCLDNKRKPLNDAERKVMQGNIPYWGANNIMDYVNDFIFDETIVLLAEDGGNFNEYKTRPIANLSHGKCWVNNHTHVLRARSDLLNEFLFYSLVHKNITGYVSGGTRAKLTKGEMLKIVIHVPSFKEQSKIANFLTAIDEKITATQSQLELVKQYKQGLLQQMFV